MDGPGLSERSSRVSTLELFFDLVFVFTITQLTSVLVAGGGSLGAAAVDEWVIYRLTGPALHALAGDGR